MAEVRDTGSAARTRRGGRGGKRRGSAGAAGAAGPERSAGSTARRSDAAAGEQPGRTVKKSVTLSETIAEEIQARTGARGFSQFLDTAAERYLALLKAQELVDEHTRRSGEFTDDDLAEAEAAWRGE